MNPPTRLVTVREMLGAMKHIPDDVMFRWYTVSHVGPNGWAVPHETLGITMGEIRRLVSLEGT